MAEITSKSIDGVTYSIVTPTWITLDDPIKPPIRLSDAMRSIDVLLIAPDLLQHSQFDMRLGYYNMDHRCWYVYISDPRTRKMHVYPAHLIECTHWCMQMLPPDVRQYRKAMQVKERI